MPWELLLHTVLVAGVTHYGWIWKFFQTYHMRGELWTSFVWASWGWSHSDVRLVKPWACGNNSPTSSYLSSVCVDDFSHCSPEPTIFWAHELSACMLLWLLFIGAFNGHELAGVQRYPWKDPWHQRQKLIQTCWTWKALSGNSSSKVHFTSLGRSLLCSG